MSRRMWITTMSLVVIGISGGSSKANAQALDDGCYELGSLCTNGRQCCSGICERDATEQTFIAGELASYCTNGL